MKLEVNTPNARRLFRMSPAPKSLPDTLYHITGRSAHDSIMREGIKPNAYYGESYFCESFEDALMFAKTYRSFVITVDTIKLDRSLIRVSEDHERKLFDCNCFRYFKTVPVEAIVDCTEVERKPYLTTIADKLLK